MRITSKLSTTRLGHLVCLLALALSALNVANARPKPVPHRGHIYIPKMLPTIIPAAREGYQTVLRGHASWYGKFFQGMETASGELYDRSQWTCAHKKLPFGTRLRVTNVDNGVTVVVRVTDRGPFRKERIIDLSEKAARPLGLVEAGSATVIAVVVPETTPLGLTDTPADLVRLRGADPRPKSPLSAYLLPLLRQTETLVAAIPSTGMAGPLASLPQSAGGPFAVQAGVFPDLRQAEAQLARIHTIDPQLLGAVEALEIDGQPASVVVVSQLTSWLAAETVRRNLQVWGIASHVRLPQPGPDALPDVAANPATATAN